MPQEQMMTTAEYLRTPESLVPTELIYGKLRVAESPLPRHQAVVLDLTLALVAPDISRQVHGLLAIPPTIAEVWTVLYLLLKGVRSSDGPMAATRRHLPAAA